jgi:hypothetical protein
VGFLLSFLEKYQPEDPGPDKDSDLEHEVFRSKNDIIVHQFKIVHK